MFWHLASIEKVVRHVGPIHLFVLNMFPSRSFPSDLFFLILCWNVKWNKKWEKLRINVFSLKTARKTFFLASCIRVSQDLKGILLSLAGRIRRRTATLAQQRKRPPTAADGRGSTECHKVKAFVMTELALSVCLESWAPFNWRHNEAAVCVQSSHTTNLTHRHAAQQAIYSAKPSVKMLSFDGTSQSVYDVDRKNRFSFQTVNLKSFCLMCIHKN